MIDLFPIKIVSKQDQNLISGSSLTTNRLVIEEFQLAELDRAFLQAQYYEDLGLDIELIIPGAAESLAMGLNYSTEDMTKFKNACTKEIEDHH